jgi:hypothetical protein
LLTLTLAHDDHVEPLPGPDVPGAFLGPRTFPLRWKCRDDSNDIKVLGKQQSQLTSYQRPE